MTVWCPEVVFVHKNGIFCGRGGEMLPPVHVQGAQRGSPVPGGDFCPQAGAFLWTRRGNSSRLSTNKAHFVDEMGLCGCHGLRWCLSGASVCLSGASGTLSGSAGSLSVPLRNPPGASGTLPEDYHSNCSLTGKRPNMPPVWMNRMFFAPTSAPPSFSSL